MQPSRKPPAPGVGAPRPPFARPPTSASRMPSTLVPKKAVRRARPLKSNDESLLVGAWLIYHLLLDARKALLRAYLRNWHRASLSLTSRLTVASSIASELQSLQQQKSQLAAEHAEYLEAEMRRLESEAAASLAEQTAAAARSAASQLASKEQELLAAHFAMQASKSLSDTTMLSAAEQQLRNSSALLSDAEARFAKEAGSRAEAEAARDAAEQKCANLLDAFFHLHSLMQGFSSTVSPISASLSSLASQVFEQAGSSAAASRARSSSRAASVHADGSMLAESRRRSHVASPSVHSVPTTSFHFAAGVLPSSHVNSGSDNVGLRTLGGSPISSGGKMSPLLKMGRSSPALLERGGGDDDEDDDDDKLRTKKPPMTSGKHSVSLPSGLALVKEEQDGDEDGANGDESPLAATVQLPKPGQGSAPVLHRVSSNPPSSSPLMRRTESFGSKKDAGGSFPSAAATAAAVQRTVKPSKSSSRGGPKHSHEVSSEGESMWEQIQTPAKTSNNVAVAVRVRPLNQREKEMHSDVCVLLSGDSCALVEPTSGEKTTFTFDYCFDTMDPSKESYADQNVVFSRLGVDILRNAWQGYNACLFAYGQTGSGKSWSITGSKENPGIIPQFCDKLFYFIEHHCPPGATISVEASYLEIYNERVQDLLNPDGANLKVREHPITGVFVEGLSYCAVDCYEDVEELMDQGTAARTIGATNMNASSSRSHSIFEMIITQETKGETESSEMQSRVVLIDLAGSERASSTGATGSRLKEGSQINKSLSELGQCIRALADSAGKKGADLKNVPFRNSVLTMLLKNSLIGNAKTTMLAAISPADANYGETMSTLRYAQSAKKIATKAVVNEDPTAKLIKELKAEINRLKDGLTKGGAAGEDKVNLSTNIGGAIQEVEAMMLEASMSKAAKRQQSERLKTRRRMTLAMTGCVDNANGDSYKRIAHLSNLNEDPMLSGTLKLVISNGTSMKLGRKDAAIPQDIQLEGLGMKKEHCIIENKKGHHLYLTLADEGADVYINGHKQIFGSPPAKLSNGDVIVLGVCTHIFRVIVPHGDESQNDDDAEDREKVSYNEAVRQVMLGRPETQHQREMRLAKMVLANWRRPVFRRMFEERLVQSLRFCSEANEIAKQMMVSTKFVLNLSCAVHLDDANSLSLKEIIKYEHIRIMIKVVNFDENDGELDEGGEPKELKMVCECHRGEFSAFLDDLRNEYNSLKSMCSHVSDDEGKGQKKLQIVKDIVDPETDCCTVADIKFRILGVVPTLVESCEVVLNKILDEHCVSNWDESTEVDVEDLEIIVKDFLENAFDTVLTPLVEECSPYGVSSAITEQDIEKYQSQFSTLILEEAAATAKFVEDVNKEFEALNQLIGTPVFSTVMLSDAPAIPQSRKFRSPGLSPVASPTVAEPAAEELESRSESWKGDDDDEAGEDDGVAFDAAEDGDGTKVEHHGDEDAEVDDWEIVWDDETKTEFWWSESRQISKWAVDGEGRSVGRPTVGAAAENEALEAGDDGGYASTQQEIEEEAASPTFPSAAILAPSLPLPQQQQQKVPQDLPLPLGTVLPDPVAMLYGGRSRGSELEESSFDENPTPDERLHTYEDEEDEILRLSVSGVLSSKAGKEELAKKIEKAKVERELDLELDEDEVEDDEEGDGAASEKSSVDDWFIVNDEVSGRDYWWSDSREEAQWVDEIEDGADDPHTYFAAHHQHHGGKKKKNKANVLRRKSLEGEAWELHTDDDGRQYLYNKATGESKWHE